MFFNNGKNRLQSFLPVVVFLLFTLLSPVFAQVQKDVNSSEGMAATAHPLATRAALDMMAKGGNAVDAAVAAAFAIGVVEPDGSGLGGGGGMVISLAGQNKNIFINYYQCASENVEKINFDFDKDKKSAKSILVPGTVAGLVTALEKFGTLPLATVLQPAISYARNGFAVDETLGKIVLDNSEVLQKYPSTSAIFLPEGFPVGQGDTLRQPLLAETLEQIALHGRSGFYEGPVAEQMVKDITENGGMVTLNDLKNYRAVVSEPLVGTFRGHKILTSQPPLSGASVLEALNILELGNLSEWGHFSTSEKSLHFLAETFKRVSADRGTSLGDPLYSTIPVKGLISKAFAKDRFATIDFGQVNPPENKQVKAGNASKYDGDSHPVKKAVKPEHTQSDTDINTEDDDQDDEIMPSSKSWKNDRFDTWGKKKQHQNAEPAPVAEPADTTDKIDDKDRLESQLYYHMSDEQYAVLAEASGEGGHTTHLSIADKAGNMVALTQTLGNFFGSGLSSAGVLFNNGLVNFSAVSEKNRIQPGKRPRSSISPTIILDKDDKPFIALGSPGAGRIIPTVTQIILNLLEYKMSITDANNAPRMYSQKFDEKLYLEGRIPVEVREALAKKGHQIQVYDDYDLYFGGAQIVEYDSQTGKFYGSADRRRGGSAGGGD